MRTIIAALAAVLAVSACGGSTDVTDRLSPDEGAWRPLAVTPADGRGGDALIQGTLQVTDECVLLGEQGEDVLLVWDAGQVTWNDEARTITFEDDATVADGDEVRMGRGGSSVDEGGAPPEEWAEGIDWVSAPAPSCLTDTRWSVDDVEPLSES